MGRTKGQAYSTNRKTVNERTRRAARDDYTAQWEKQRASDAQAARDAVRRVQRDPDHAWHTSDNAGKAAIEAQVKHDVERKR